MTVSRNAGEGEGAGEGAAPADVSAALHRVRAYLAHDPENPALLARAAGLALRAGLPGEAEEAIGRLAARAGESAAVLQLRAQVLLARQRYEDAIPLLERACTLSAEWGVRSDLALALLRCGRPRDCVALVETVAAGDPAALPPPMLASYLRALHALGELEAAKDIFDALVRAGMLNEPNDELRGIGALVLFDLELVDDAADLLGGIAHPEAMNLEACVVGGYLAVARQDAAAMAWFEPALAKSPGDPRTLLGLGVARMAAGDLAAGERWLRQAVARMPSHLGSWHALGWCRLCAGDLAEATAIFRTALEVDRTFGETHGALAVMLAMAGDRDEATQSLARARKLDPASASAQFAELLLRGDAKPADVQALARRLMTGQRGGR